MSVAGEVINIMSLLTFTALRAFFVCVFCFLTGCAVS